MTTRKIQNFVRTKVGNNNPLSIQFSKQKLKTELQEDLFAFETLDSDNELESITTNTKNDIPSEKDVFSHFDDMETRNNTECEIVSDNQDYSSSSNAMLPLRTRVDNIGKSVNSVFKDAHSAINAIIKDPSKKGIRKPSDVAKGTRFSGFGKRKVATTAVIPDDEKSNACKSMVGELEDINDDINECVLTERNREPDKKVVTEECITVSINKPDEIIDLRVIDESLSKLIDKHLNLCEKSAIVEDYRDTEPYQISEQLESIESNPYITEESSIDDTETSNNFNFKIIVGIGAFLLIFFFLPISKFILGLLCGILISFGLYKLYDTLLSSVNDVKTNDEPYPNLRELKSPVIPHIENTVVQDEYATMNASFSAWVNAVNGYHPSSYNISASYSLHLSLEGTKLFIRKPKSKISPKALCNNSKLSGLTLSSERIVELLHSKVHLLPYGLIQRRMWSKKYPICITVNKCDDDNSLKCPISMSKSMDHDANLNVENYYFFNRTCREKEEMFRRLMAASLGMPINLTVSDIIDKYLCKEVSDNSPVPLMHFQDIKDAGSTGKIKDDSTNNKQRAATKVIPNSKEPQIVTFVRYMARFMPSDSLVLEANSNKIDLNYISCEAELLWLNALIGRIAWNVFRGNHWIKVIREKIQKKLKKLHLPYFIDQLEISDIDLGSEIPVIRKVSRPYLDNRGMWVEFEVLYAGGFSMGLETKMNLMKLKNLANKQKSGNNKSHRLDYCVKYNMEAESAQSDINNDNNNNEPDVSSVDFNLESKMSLPMTTGGGTIGTEDEEDKGTPPLCSDDSFASSSESDMPGDRIDFEEGNIVKGLSQSSSNKSFPQWIDKIAKSSYFQKAADNKYVLRTMEYVSNTSLQLQVDAQYLSGTLVMNIPPPPSDRLWWGFKRGPKLNIKARPKVGQKEIQMTKLVEFIEKKLLQEFHRALVMPNMDDITIPLLFNDNPQKFSQTL